MGSAYKKSKRRSDSSSEPPKKVTLFIDRCAWTRTLEEALKEHDIPFVAHKDIFAQDCPDDEWLRGVAERGWIVVTRDKNIRRKANELRAFRESGLHVFVLASGNASAEDHATLIIELYPKFLAKAHTTSPPAMFSVSLGRSISLIR
ncbi:hypothetical protein IRY61_03145 [Candidatus Saccharibacteria bacterium]|nr:hypothetical protein [Candidatus Saccharibacteria bacterium]